MEKMIKFLLICLGVIVMSFQTQLFAQKAYQVEVLNGEIRLEDLPDNREGALAMSSVLLHLDRLRDPMLKILIPPGKITEFFTTNRDAKLVGNTIHITQKGKYDTEIKLDGQNKHNSFYVNYKAYLFYGDVSQIDSLKGAMPASSKITLAGETLAQSIGVPSGYFRYSWWDLAKSKEEEGVQIGEKLNNMKFQEILEKAREHYPDHQGSFFLKVQFSDGMGNYDPDSETDFDRSHCMVELVPPPPAVAGYQLNLAPQGQGQLLARVDGQLVRSGDKVQSGKQVVLEIKPSEGFRLKYGSLVLTTEFGKQIPIEGNSFIMPVTNGTVSAVFENIPQQSRLHFPVVGEGRIKCYVNFRNETTQSGSMIDVGTRVDLEAEPAPGWRFVRWRDGRGEYSTNPEIYFYMPYVDPRTSLVMTAEFENIANPGYVVTIAPLQNGTIVATPTRARVGEKVSLAIKPAEGYRLKVGSLKVVDAQGRLIPVRDNGFEMPESNVTVSAEFELIPPPAKKQYAISFSHEGEGSLVAKVDNQPINSGDLVEEGKTVVFTATPAEKWRIKNWEPENGTNQEYRIVSLSQGASVKVVFEPVPTPPPPAKKQYEISFSHQGEGSLVAKVDNQPINSGDLVEEGKTVVFTAIPADKWRIKNWEPENGTNQEYRIVSLSQATSVKVVFESVSTPPVKVDHSVTVVPLQNGTIVATPAKAKAGDQVQLKVNPAVGYRLKEGSLTVTSVGNQTISVLDNRFIMPDTEVNITAEFEPIPLDPETLLPHLTGIDTTPLKKGTGYTFVWEEMEKTATNFTLELIDTKTHKQVTNLDSSVDVNQVQLQFSQAGVFDFKIKFEVAGKAYFVSWRIIVE